MDRDRARERRRESGGWLLSAWAVAIIPNALDTFGFDPDGWAWTALRIALLALFTVALMVFLVRVAQELPARPAPKRRHQSGTDEQ
jgi:hypothetical protein